ncbi:MAG TPA: hypothetical protein VMG99_01120 [Thermoplasmata archaeon]|nr:hypothetical protein [Thermoplasmata archaeon]HTW55459.1 hypothetical protein [Thermoplasmata archaeon]
MQSPTVVLPTWYRALAIVVGLISIALAFVVLLDPALGLLTLVFLLGFALLVIGIDRLASGVSGHPYSFFGMPGVPPTGHAPAGPESPPANKP